MIFLFGLKTNGQNHTHFEEWAKKWTKVQLVSDNSTSNEASVKNPGVISSGISVREVPTDSIKTKNIS